MNPTEHFPQTARLPPLGRRHLWLRSQRSVSTTIGGVLVLLLIACAVPLTASAKQVRLLTGKFGGAATTPADPYPLEGPQRIAVDQVTHDVYVTDAPEHRVQKFDAAGHFLLMLGKEVNKTAIEAVRPEAEQNICPDAGHPADVCQAGTEASTPGGFQEPAFLAVDNSSGESQGDLYVGDQGRGANAVQTVKIEATGGTYTLSFAGKTSAPIAFNAPVLNIEGAGSFQHAIEEIAGGGGIGKLELKGGTYTIEFVSRLGLQDLPSMTANSSGLKGGPATATVTTITHGFSTARIEKLSPAGTPVATWAEGGQFSGSNVKSPPAPFAGPFVEVYGTAVDPTGNLWVAGAFGKIFEFKQDATYITAWNGPYNSELAVDPAGNVYFRESGAVTEFLTTGQEIGHVAPSKAEIESLGSNNTLSPHGIAVDPLTGDLYVDGEHGTEGIVQRYDSTCHPVITEEIPQPGCAAVESFGGGGLLSEYLGGATIDAGTPADTAYVVDTLRKSVAVFSLATVPDILTTAPTSPTHTSATLTATVNPAGIELNAGLTGCRFEWGETAAYGNTAACDKSAAQIGSGVESVEVHAAITGLEPGKTYHYRLVASNANDVNGLIDQPSTGQDLAFGPPEIEVASALSVFATDAELQAQFNANNLDTHVRIEYGLEAGTYEHATAAVDTGSAGTGQTQSFELAELTAATTYHYRVVGENVLGEGPESSAGADQTFTTQAKGTFALLDERSWELVSPPDKHGANIESLEETGVIQAAADGNAVSYLANAPTEADGPANADAKVQVLSTHSAGGWSSLDIATPHLEEIGTPGGPGAEYKFFSSDLSLAAVEPLGSFVPGIAPEASEKTPYIRADFPAGSPGAICGAACYRPLVDAGNVPAGTEFGEETRNCHGVFCGPQFLSATPDLSQVVLTAAAPLVEGAPPGSLYEWAAGRLQVVSVLPEAGGFSGHVSAELPPGSISSDGRRVVWAEGAGTGSAKHLYLRDTAAGEGGETLRLDRVKGGTGTGTVAPVFQSASSEDSVILFTDEQRLTAGAGAAPERPDLYRCEISVGETGELECALTDLTPSAGPESANVLGVIRGATDHGSYAYFVAQGALAPGASPGDCGGGEPGNVQQANEHSCNLYVSHEGATIFIASLSGADHNSWGVRGTARVSPNGRWLAFMSQRPLTGYDNRDVATGKLAAEVYLYDAEANKLICASCNPTGARPRGVVYDKLLNGLDSGGGKGTWEHQGIVAANVPGWTGMNSGVTGYQDRYLTDSGRVFFNSTDALVPQDSNGTVDVYEYEPTSAGDCAEPSQTFSARSAGCIDMVSKGTSRDESVFLDASESANDVFFLTSAQLSQRDTDSTYDVYDARVGGGEIQPTKPVECLGAACQGIVEPPNDPTPNSLTFQGPENLVPTLTTAKPPAETTAQIRAKKLLRALKLCRRIHQRHRRRLCEVTAHKRYGPLKAHKSTTRKATHRPRSSR